jgi:hypothetical protein
MQMNGMPASLQLPLRRLARRLAVGMFLDRWPIWAAAGLLLAGVVALICRMFVPAAAPFLVWLWLAPVIAAIPVLILCVVRAYRPGEVVAVADWLGGGKGTLLTLLEHHDSTWASSPSIAATSTFALPRFRPWRKLAIVLPAATFLAIASLLPQRTPPPSVSAALADGMAADLTSTLAALKQQDLITPAEEQRLEEAIERIRQSAEKRVDASSWEAMDALRDQVKAGLSEKQNAVKWARESLSRYAAAATAGAGGEQAKALSAELARALEKLAQSGVLAGGLSPELKAMLAAGQLPDAATLAQLTAALAEQLASADLRMGDIAALTGGAGRFDPGDFPVGSGQSEDGDGRPGRGGVNRGRADAELTYGNESAPAERFKAKPLPPGAARSPDDWAPIVTLPGAPEESARLSTAAAARQYDAAAGQSAWRRTLAPRHQSAVKKYFEK